MRKTLLLFVLMLLALPSKLWAQENDYRIHAVFLYNFTKYVQWPSAGQSGDFVIGVVGNSSIYDELVKITNGKMAGTQKIVVTKFKSADAITNCQMLFVSSQVNFENVQSKLAGKPVLVITEKPGLAQKGSNINFVIKENKWRFELNENSTRQAGLKVSAELSKLAISV
ncbi:YfiR family protein [Xanthocytophaga flavus]|nr:YfiR family protein [Xanthocytophaga flavus]